MTSCRPGFSTIGKVRLPVRSTGLGDGQGPNDSTARSTSPASAAASRIVSAVVPRFPIVTLTTAVAAGWPAFSTIDRGAASFTTARSPPASRQIAATVAVGSPRSSIAFALPSANAVIV